MGAYWAALSHQRPAGEVVGQRLKLHFQTLRAVGTVDMREWTN